MVVRDVANRWNYTDAMIVRGSVLRKAVNSWVINHENLQHLFITPSEWIWLDQVEGVLK
ncbi:hypothetical protein SCHPADRAFT_792411, partial [Schizopora paradoxa]